MVDVQRRMDETWAGDRPVDPRTYPYFNPDYRLPFKHIGLQKQLFLDNYILDELIDAERTVPPPQKAEPPLIEFENLPWERYHFTSVPAAALYDPDDRLFKMWYKTLVSGNTNSAQGTEVVLCYAESDDALYWRKPLREDCQPFEDSEKTNIVVRDFDNGAIVLNPDRSDPERKFLAVYNPSMEAARRGQRVMSRVAASPAGNNWQVISDDSPFRHHHQMRVIWDDAYNKWVGYSQASPAFASHLHVRTIGRQESADFINWSPKEVALSADWDANLPPDLEMHDMSARKVGGLYIGITSEFMAEPFWQERDGHNWRDQAFSRLGLYTSRDGKRWQRVGGPGPWVDTGSPGDQDYGFACFTPAGELVHNGKLVIPYSANPQKQSWLDRGSPTPSYPPEEFERRRQAWHARQALQGDPETKRAVGGLVLREDGWARLMPEYETGKAYTKQFVFEGDALRVNADCSYGYVQVELLDPTFTPYEGFSAELCDPVIGAPDQIWHTVSWQGSSDLRALWNRPVRIRFTLREASIYAFQFFEFMSE